MNLSLEQVVIAVPQIALLVAMWTRLETSFGSHVRQSNARVAELEKRVGLKNGGGPEFVRRTECADKEKRSNDRLNVIEDRGEDHEHRLTVVETKVLAPP